ncbi:MAG TPA: hypothetical protein VEW48_10820 [Thermoanaerobaculia bacterium]|nr:hypothetical protein [Thermoanaerobaculia bacterium]
MIFRFVSDYSQRSALRREFADDPNSVLDRYDIAQAERQHLLAGDREQVARQLHAEIDEMFSGCYYAFLWPMYYPNVVGQSTQQAGRKGEAVEIAIPALNLAPQVKVRFYRGALKLDATILEIDHSPQSRVDTIHCQAVFPEDGSWDVEIINLVEGEERSDVRKNYLTISGDQSNGLLDAISDTRIDTACCEARWTGGSGEARPVCERISRGRHQRSVRAASWSGSGPGGSARLLGWPGRQAQALAGSRAGSAPSFRTGVAAAA